MAVVNIQVELQKIEAALKSLEALLSGDALAAEAIVGMQDSFVAATAQGKCSNGLGLFRFHAG
jgi:hypothetical protein